MGAADGDPISTCAAGTEHREERWLPHCTEAELYDQYKAHIKSSGEESISLSVFRKAHKKWKGVLRIRRESQHARCEDCAKYTKFRKIANTDKEREQIQAAYNQHIDGVFKDRAFGSKMVFHSETSTAPTMKSTPDQSLLYVCLDGMDQVRFAICVSCRCESLYENDQHIFNELLSNIC